MLSKCANPECAAKFRFLHQGKLFLLTPTPEVRTEQRSVSSLNERFWLCEQCSKKMTIVWGGTSAKLVRLPEKPVKLKVVEAATVEMKAQISPKRRAARAGKGDTPPVAS